MALYFVAEHFTAFQFGKSVDITIAIARLQLMVTATAGWEGLQFTVSNTAKANGWFETSGRKSMVFHSLFSAVSALGRMGMISFRQIHLEESSYRHYYGEATITSTSSQWEMHFTL